jgi:hypothetical protein
MRITTFVPGRLAAAVAAFALLGACSKTSVHAALGAGAAIAVTPDMPAELNPPYAPGPPASGGAPVATPDQAAQFAWGEFSP